MSYRFMRVLVLYDLPSIDYKERIAYRKFRRFLIKNGFIMMQESVYTKLALNQSAVNSVIDNIKKNKPKEGLVQILCITEKQFSKVEFIVGENISNVINNTERLLNL